MPQTDTQAGISAKKFLNKDGLTTLWAKIKTLVSSSIEASEGNTVTMYNSLNSQIMGIKTTLGSVYKPAGSVKFSHLPTPSAEILGNVYNVKNAFTEDNRFLEFVLTKQETGGADPTISLPAGTNVMVVQASTAGGDPVYYFDALSGMTDLSAYMLSADILTTSDINNICK